MKKNLFLASLLSVGLAFSAVSCDSNDDPTPEVPATDVDYTAENASAWGNYMKNVGRLLNTDSENLYNAWAVNYNNTGKTYAELFKSHDASTGYSSIQSCAQEIVEKCAEIANEVGTAKIGDPYNLYVGGDEDGALLAVESWYSWHSIDDYSNNIVSIKNSYYGIYIDGEAVTANAIESAVPAEHSLAKALENTTIGKAVDAAINDAWKAIQAIPAPFRNHIVSSQTEAAMAACSKLQKLLSEVEAEDGSVIGADDVNLKDAVNNIPEAELQAIVNHYVDNVVVPTYKKLQEKNKALLAAVDAFAANPSNEGFTATCNAWLAAREPWEKSEAFLFGPVDEFGLDPNMDSWPLDAPAIVQIMKSESWSSLIWKEGDDDAAVESAQNVRGFHTLEFLVFKDGKARTVPAK